ncbi:unnamed protein product [Urochloa humidicola]
MDGGGIDLNSQAEEFPTLGLYGAFLQGDVDGLLPGGGRGKGSGLPPYRQPRAGEADGWATPFARQLNFGGSSSAAAGRGGGNGGMFLGGSSTGAGGGVQQRANSAAAAPSRRNQRTSMANHHGGGGQRVPRPRAPRAPRSAIRGQASGSRAPFVDGDEEMEDEVEELASSGGPPVKKQILILKSTHSFWRYLQAHTGLGRKDDGTIDADSEFWKTHTEKKPYLKKLQWGPPANEDLLDLLFRGSIVDGSTAYAPGDDYGENQGQEEEEFQTTPGSTNNQRSQKVKRSLSTSSTLTSPLKKSKSPMLKVVKDITSTFKESVIVNTKQMQKRASEKAAFFVKRCQELAFVCGVEQTVEAVYAMSKMFETQYQREFFCGQLTPNLRFGYFKKWCRDNNLE